MTGVDCSLLGPWRTQARPDQSGERLARSEVTPMKRLTILAAHTCAAVAAIALLFAPVSTLAQITFGPGGITIGPTHGGGGGHGWRGGGGGYDFGKMEGQGWDGRRG